MNPEAIADGQVGPDRFHTTRWSVVLDCAGSGAGEETVRKALDQLCKTYWRPVFAFICRSGHSVPDAQDLTQDFFVMVLKGHLLQRADPDRGRFRSLLLKALKDFLANAHIKSRTLKRGGDAQFVSWDEWMAEVPSRLLISAREAETWPAERIFDVRWAATAAEHALRQLGEECEARGRRRVFDVLSDCLAAERQDVSYQKLSQTLGIPEASVKSLVHELRVRYRELCAQKSRKPWKNRRMWMTSCAICAPLWRLPR